MSDPALEDIKMWQRETEKRIIVLETHNEVDAERYKNMMDRLQKIENGMSKVIWLIAAVIIGGAMNFILSGGLNIAQ